MGTYECCLKDNFASCGGDMQSKISTMMSTMKTQYDAILPGLSKCASATCSSGTQPTPAEVETTLMANIQISDPLAFSLDAYVEAVKKATGVAKLPEVVVKAFGIFVKYVLPDATEIATAKVAIAKVETKIKSAPSATNQLVSQIESAGSDVGGTIKAEVKTAAPQASFNGASSNFRFVLVALVVLLRAAF